MPDHDEGVPVPSLRYGLHDRAADPAEVRGEGPPLHRVHEAVAWEENGNVVIYLRGRVLKKDGTPGKHSRSVRVYLFQRQPLWLDALIDDAIERLLTSPLTGSSEVPRD